VRKGKKGEALASRTERAGSLNENKKKRKRKPSLFVLLMHGKSTRVILMGGRKKKKNTYPLPIRPPSEVSPRQNTTK